jgi:hypothetical protein
VRHGVEVLCGDPPGLERRLVVERRVLDDDGALAVVEARRDRPPAGTQPWTGRLEGGDGILGGGAVVEPEEHDVAVRHGATLAVSSLCPTESQDRRLNFN